MAKIALVLCILCSLTFAQELSKKCLNELTAISETDLKKLPSEVLTIKAKAKTGEIPIIGSFFGPGPDNKVTNIGVTVGCLKALPDNPKQLQSLMMDLSPELATNGLMATAANTQNHGIETQGSNNETYSTITGATVLMLSTSFMVLMALL